jgi:hypothetical protein
VNAVITVEELQKNIKGLSDALETVDDEKKFLESQI